MAQRVKYTNVSTGTAQIANAPVVLSGIVVTSVGSSGTMVIYDGVDATTTLTMIPEFACVLGTTNFLNTEAVAGVYIESNGTPIVTFLTLSAD